MNINQASAETWPSAAWPNRIGGGEELAFTPPEPSAGPDAGIETSFFGADGFTFADLIDVINPLQHLPLAGSLYRGMSGDEIAAGPRVLGATLFFGPIGLASSLVNLVVEDATGKDIGDHIVAFFGESSTEHSPPTELALAGADAARFETAAGTVTTPEDPVSAWARGEAAWAAGRTQPKPIAENGTRRDPMPDASAQLSDAGDWMPALLADAGGRINPNDAVAAYRRAGTVISG